ncbi:phage portal protein [Xanthomonas campestris pv. asclepiadis]|uniref:phage portal protein n=1 Tax=Xanthomonas campestris TaxID=339 RepID=UPI001E3F416B|nr:phage portal protein [Xanthomonas campestris]MCC4618262.1 phage portal protein [Xanthomonas campestris pv. asclepiadis]
MAEFEGSYRAGGMGRRLRLLPPVVQGPNAALVNLPTVLARARHLARNDPWAVSALNKSVSNGIATGIQAKPLWGTKAFKAATSKLWKRWIKYSDADGVLDFYGQQALAWREWKEAGEVFARIRFRRPGDGLPVPMQLQLVESEQCPRGYYSVATNGNVIREGIEFDAIGRRVAYWMFREHPGDQAMVPNGHELVRVPAEQVIHLYRPNRAGALRGVPASAAVLLRMFNLDRLDDAVLERQAIANLFAGFYKVPEAQEGELGGATPMTDDMQTGMDADGTPLAGLEPATMQELPPGYEVQFSTPPGAGTDYAEFLRGHLMAIAAGHDIPYEVLTGDLRNVSDRALRLILNEFRRVIESDQWLYMIPMFCQRVRDAWFDQAVLAGLLAVPGYADQRDEVTETLWVPEGWPWSHPVQDVGAEKAAVRAGFKSRDKVILGAGEDPEQVDTEIKASNDRADALGLVLDSDARRTNTSGAEQSHGADNGNSGDPQGATDEGNPDEQ